MSDRSIPETDLVRWSEALAGIARTGLAFTESLYERERYEEVLHVAADIRASADDRESLSEDAVVDQWIEAVDTGVKGYVTPKVAVGALVANELGELLLIKRGDSGVWLYPTGWADIGYSASEVVVKEVAEETGIEAEPQRIVALVDSLRLGARGLPFYSIVFLMKAVGGQLNPHPLEASDLGWFSKDRLPQPLAGGGRWVDMAFSALDGSLSEVAFDPPRQQTWRNGTTP